MHDENRLCQKDPASTGQLPASAFMFVSWTRSNTSNCQKNPASSEKILRLASCCCMLTLWHRWWSIQYTCASKNGRDRLSYILKCVLQVEQNKKKTVEGCSACIHPSSFMLQSHSKPATKAIDRTEHSPYPILEYKIRLCGKNFNYVLIQMLCVWYFLPPWTFVSSFFSPSIPLIWNGFRPILAGVNVSNCTMKVEAE